MKVVIERAGYMCAQCSSGAGIKSVECSVEKDDGRARHTKTGRGEAMTVVFWR